MKIIAHRGASGEFPENTSLAFEQAIIQGADGIELDIQYHNDSGEFILLHDVYVKNRHGDDVHYNDLTLAQLLTLPLPHSQHICTLKQALQLIKGRCLLNIEIKSADQGAALQQQLLSLQQCLNQALQQQHFSAQQIIISSFNHVALVTCQQLMPQFTYAALIACCPVNYAGICADLPVKMLNPTINCLNQELVQSAQTSGLSVWVYTVDHINDISRCLRYGVNAIFTNYPKKTRCILESLQHRQ